MSTTDFNKEQPARASTIGKITVYLSFILIIPIFLYVAKRNDFKRYDVKINESASGIDVQLKRRKDTLTKLIDAVKGSIKFEQETLQNITKLRSTNTNPDNVQEQSEINTLMDKVSHDINVQLEAYPDLKTTQNILNLQNAITEIEDDLAAARRIYNSNVSIYNANIQTFPANVAASSLHLSTKLFFQASEIDRQDVKVDLV